MTQSTTQKNVQKSAKAVKHEGWKEEAKGQLQKWGGAVTGNEVDTEEGKQRQAEGNMEKHIGKMIEDQTKI